MRDIAILLPYKENFTENNAGAASIWVKDYLNRSKLKKRSIVIQNGPAFLERIIFVMLHKVFILSIMKF